MAIARRLPDWVWLLLIGLLAQFFWFWRLPEPTHMDAYYYLTNGIRLAEGHGFTEEVIWQYLDEPASLPTPSHSYWMPLPSMLAALGWLIQPTFRAAQLPFYLLTATLPLLSFGIANWLWHDRQLAWLASLLTAAGGFYASAWNQPETFAPFAWAGGLALWYLALARTGDQRRHWFGAGLLAALAHLSRADGLLFLGIGGLLLWPRRWDRQTVGAQIPAGLALGAGYLLVMGPWLLRNWRVLGRPLTTAGSQTLFLTSYDDLFAFGRQISLADYLAWGGGNILSSKLAGLSVALQTFIAICGLIVLTPLILVAWRHLWRGGASRARVLPLTLYTILLFLAMSLFFTYPGMRGGLFHSTTAIWPWLMALAPAGLRQSINWVAARRPSWEPATAWRVFAPALVLLAFGLTVAAGGTRAQQDEIVSEIYPQLAAWLPAGATVLVRDPPGFYYHTGHPAISVPNEPLAGALAAARQYGADFLILDESHPQPLAELYAEPAGEPALELLTTIGTVQLYRLPDP